MREQPPAPTVEEVGAGIFAYVQLDGGWGPSNAVFVAGAEGVVLVDTLYLFPQAAVIGHELCREEAIAAGFHPQTLFPGVDWGEIELRPPSVTFPDRLTLHAGGEWLDAERFVANLHRAYAELGAAPEPPAHVLYDEMIALKGGALHCVA